MYAALTVTNEEIPPNVGTSYGPLKFGKYGVFGWIYHDKYWGPIHWINWKDTIIVPDAGYGTPTGYYRWCAPNVFIQFQIVPTINTPPPDVLVGQQLTNLLKGKGVPVKT